MQEPASQARRVCTWITGRRSKFNSWAE